MVEISKEEGLLFEKEIICRFLELRDVRRAVEESTAILMLKDKELYPGFIERLKDVVSALQKIPLRERGGVLDKIRGCGSADEYKLVSAALIGDVEDFQSFSDSQEA